MNWYVLQVMTGDELNVADKLRQHRIGVMVPQEQRAIRSAGSWHYKDFVLFRGYVFVKLEYTAEIYHIIRRYRRSSDSLGHRRSRCGRRRLHG